jgi:hypothetical protein
MKIALMMGGDLRTFMDCFPSLESNILKYNQCDVYLHLYDEPMTQTAIDMLSPVKYVIEDKKSIRHDIQECCFKNKAPEVDCVGVFFMWRTIKVAYNLLQDKNYDMVIKTRYDVKYTNPLMVNNFDPSKLNVPNGGDWRGGLFDMFAMSSQKIMSRYCSLYDKLNTYVSSGLPFHSEILNLHNNKNENINRFDYTILLRRQFDRDFVEDRVFTLR